MDKIEAKVRMYEAVARAYGGPSSLHKAPEDVAKVATAWYNDAVKLEVPDTAPVSSTLTVPRKPPPK